MSTSVAQLVEPLTSNQCVRVWAPPQRHFFIFEPFSTSASLENTTFEYFAAKYEGFIYVIRFAYWYTTYLNWRISAQINRNLGVLMSFLRFSGKHIILKKQDVLDEYVERVKRRGSLLKEVDPTCLRWTPFVPPQQTPVWCKPMTVKTPKQSWLVF